MTDKEIRQKAASRLAASSGSCVSLIVFLFAVLTFLALCEATIYLSIRDTAYGGLYDLGRLTQSRSVLAFWVIKTLMELALMTPLSNLVRRQFIDVARGRRMNDTRQYITAHAFKYYSRAFYSSFIHNLIKFFAAVPGMISLYGIYYWSYVTRINDLTLRGLFVLTVCVGFTVVWIGLLVRYYISLALTPYIMALNPRTNVFDACDLSVRLMDGQHIRYIKFVAYFLLYLPLVLLIYPIMGIYPYYKISYTLLIDELLGDFSNDKMPGMIKRWRKYR